MYRENSWDDSKQRLEELFKLTSLDRFVANGSGERFGTIARLTIVSNGAVRTDDNFFQWIAWVVRRNDNFSRTDSLSRWNDTKSLDKPFTTIGNIV